MRKNYRRAVVQPKKHYKINEQITAETVRLIGENDVYIGILPLAEAIQKAREAELDLVEINPSGNPAVCKLDDYGRLRYNEERDLRKQKAKQKKVEVKGLRLSVRIGKHDMDVRLKQAEKFLEQNDKVKIEVVLRGRERQHTELAREVLKTFTSELEAKGFALVIESNPMLQGGRLSTIIGLKKT